MDIIVSVIPKSWGSYKNKNELTYMKILESFETSIRVYKKLSLLSLVTKILEMYQRLLFRSSVSFLSLFWLKTL